MPRVKKNMQKNGAGAKLGFEEKLWQAADKMRGHMDPGEYKHVALGLIFLKYISDAFEDHRAYLSRESAKAESPMFVREPAAREDLIDDRDEYMAENVFWVPKTARWTYLQERAKRPEIGKLIDEAMAAIEKENPILKGVLPKDYARPSLDKQKLGELIDLVGGIGLGDQESRSKDILGRVYEYFLSKFASAEGKKGGEFYTPPCVVRLLVEMIEPYKGRVYDPCCGSSGMFVQSEKFIRAHGGRIGDISIYGQESNPTTWKLAKMNLALRGIEADLGDHSDDSFTHDLHQDLRADFVIANPPFNVSNWWSPKLADDPRWKYGVPPEGNANFAWVQHFIYHLSPRGTAGFVLANGSLSSKSSGEGDIRRRLVEADLVDCIVAMPDRLFFNTGIPVSLWFVSRDRHGNGHRKRQGEVLFIDARTMGSMETRRLRVLTGDDIAKIAGTYHDWRNRDGSYEDVPGFAKAATLDEISKHHFVLTPGRYVGSEEAEVDDEPIGQKLNRLTTELFAEFDRGRELEEEVRHRLGGLRT